MKGCVRLEINIGDYVYIKPLDPDAGEQRVYGGCYTSVLDVAVDGLCQLNIDNMADAWHQEDLEKQLPIGTRVRVSSPTAFAFLDETGVIVDVENANQGGPFGFWYTVDMDGSDMPSVINSNAVEQYDPGGGDTDGDPVTAKDLESILFS